MDENHRRNSNFQIAYFIGARSHTPDKAYARFCDLREDRQLAINEYETNLLRVEARKRRLKWKLWSPFRFHRLEARAELDHIKRTEPFTRTLYEAAIDELAFIEKCIEKVNPLRKFRHLPDAEAHEASQREYWRMELISRAQNYLIERGSIPADEFNTMRCHPDFGSSIYPAIEKMMKDGSAELQNNFVPQIEECLMSR